MNDRNRSDDLSALIAKAADAPLSAEDAAALQELLVEDPAALDTYLDQCELHTDLRFVLRAQQLDEQIAVRIVDDEQLALCDERSAMNYKHPLPLGEGRGEGLAEEAFATKPRPKSLLNWASRHPKGPAIAIAATVLVAALVVLGLVPVKDWVANRNTAKPEDSVPAENEEFVARLSNWHNDKWADDSRPPMRDPRLAIGRRLVLTSGLAEITYNSGARVVLEGPAAYEVVGKKYGYLQRGKLAALVEAEEAKGFVVETPVATIEDLGTEFGIDVGRDHVVHVHTFDGAVSVSGANGSAAVEVTANRYVDVEPSGRVGAVQVRTVKLGRFVRSLPEKPTIPATHTFMVSTTHRKDRFIEGVAEVWHIDEHATLTLTGDKLNGRLFIATNKQPLGDGSLTIVGGGMLHVAGGKNGIGSVRLGHMLGNGVGSLSIRGGSTVRIEDRLFGSGDGGVIDLVDGTLVLFNEPLGRPWDFADFGENQIELRADGQSNRPEAFEFSEGAGELSGYTIIRPKPEPSDGVEVTEEAENQHETSK